MARGIRMLVGVMAFTSLLVGAQAQEPAKKGKLDAEVIFKKLDADSDGKLSKEEFLKLADNFKNRDQARQKLVQAFEKFDTDKVGLNPEQFRKYLDSVRKKSDNPR